MMHIGPYRVERPLGAGGMGEVLLAYDERLDRRVAIKRIRHGAGTTDTDRERFRREARAAAGLSHPAIVQVHDILSHDDDDAIVMELVQGQSVAERLKSGPLPLAEALRLARDVAEGLAEAHRIGLVHRDLKAENVMVTPSGHAKILDFGLAKRLHHDNLEETLTRQGALVGTVRAMAPEQAGGREVEPRSDLFSLGVLLYEMVTGHSPFRGATALLTLRRVVTESPRPLRERRPDVPLELPSLIERLLEKAPEHRPSDAAEVTRTLEAIAARLTADNAPPLAPDEHVSFNDVPTGSLPAPQRALVAESPPPTAPESGESSMRLVAVQRRWLWAAILAALVVLAAILYWRGAAGGLEPLRVVVLRPEITATEPSNELDMIVSGVLIASLGTLVDLEGIAPVEPAEIGETSGTTLDVARAVAAKELAQPRPTSGMELLTKCICMTAPWMLAKSRPSMLKAGPNEFLEMRGVGKAWGRCTFDQSLIQPTSGPNSRLTAGVVPDPDGPSATALRPRLTQLLLIEESLQRLPPMLTGRDLFGGDRQIETLARNLGVAGSLAKKSFGAAMRCQQRPRE